MQSRRQARRVRRLDAAAPPARRADRAARADLPHRRRRHAVVAHQLPGQPARLPSVTRLEPACTARDPPIAESGPQPARRRISARVAAGHGSASWCKTATVIQSARLSTSGYDHGDHDAGRERGARRPCRRTRPSHTVTCPALGDYRVMARAPAPAQHDGDRRAVAGRTSTATLAAASALTEVCVTIAGTDRGRPGRRDDHPADAAAAATGSRRPPPGSPRWSSTGARSRCRYGYRPGTPTRAPRSARSARAQPDARARLDRARRPAGQRDAGPPVRRGREPRTAYPAGRDPWLRRTDPARAGGRLPDDVAYAMSRVESESARMTTLVEDLLLLARLDAGRPLDREPVDLSRLVVDVVSDAHVAGPRPRSGAWTCPTSRSTVVGDEPRLHQVLANLLANARTHTPPGTKVTVALAADAPTAARRSRSPTTARASRERCCRRCSSGSPAATRPGRARPAAPASASRSCRRRRGARRHGQRASQPGETVFTVTLPPGETSDLDGDPAEIPVGERADDAERLGSSPAM